MAFEDIDTPADEALLLGSDSASDSASATPPANTETETPAKQDDKQPDTTAKPAEGDKPADKTADKPADKAPEKAADDTGGEPKKDPDGTNDDGRSPVIPRARFDEVQRKLHEEREARARLEGELSALRPKPDDKKDTPPEINLDELRSKEYDAMLEGNKDEALRLRAQIDAEIYRRAKVEAKVEAKDEAVQEVLQLEENREFKKAVSESVAKYPFLNDKAPEANREAIDEVIAWRDLYRVQGATPAESLRKAVERVCPAYVKKEQEKQPEPTEPPKDPRKEAAVDRNIAAASAQPAQTDAGIGNRAVPPGPKIDTQADWEKLSDAERERILREGA